MAQDILITINNHVIKIHEFLEQLDGDKLNKWNVQTLINNELHGIQNELSKLGLWYVDDEVE